ncbi:MAG: UDP-N-acetylmuramoyl-tripeptide--D-alanyl-D-alanine ligase [Rickettsiaceae bacterium H1]|nr:UDP-N-acetylmuramoyl-tripeptide--D-alanyl-D-alanine ligase [Rickettsiaceae bacterium H1]
MKITNKDVQVALSTDHLDNWEADGISIDSRTTQSKNLFVAIKGENFDSHNFIQEAERKGAIAVIVNRQIKTKIPIIIVKNTIKAIQDLARHKRTQTSAKMIGITGSVGKTTTKDMTYHMLSCYGKTYRNSGNLNNHIGLPLSLLNAPEDADYVILEMGMNHAGEIELLSNIMQPDISIITNIGPAHLEFFSSVKEIARAKAEIFTRTKGIVILNKEDEYYDYLYKSAKQYSDIRRIITVGINKNTNVKLVNYDENNISVLIGGKQQIKLGFPTIYEHLIINSLFPLGIIYALNLELNKSADSLNQFELQKGRGNIHRVNDITIIDDTYNASPPAVKAAIKFLSRFNGRKIAILGDMFELGNKAKELHIDLVNTIIHYKIDLVFTVGTNMRFLYEHLEKDKIGRHFDKSNNVNILPDLKKGDVILVKGSRGIKMERIVEKLLSHVK